MIIDAKFLSEWIDKGHVYGQCLSLNDLNLMYVNIPKNASSWTKPNLLTLNWEFYNFHTDSGLSEKTAMVVLRDPVDRWLSGIAEYFFLYHPEMDWDNISQSITDLVFDRIVFDDHTEQQIKFVHGLDKEQCIFFKFGPGYRRCFSEFLSKRYHITNSFWMSDYQHVSENSPGRKKIKEFFKKFLEQEKYRNKIRQYYKIDYDLINSVEWWGSYVDG